MPDSTARLAAEIALGLAPSGVAAPSDEVEAWNTRLGAMALAVPPVEPPRHLWQAIAARLDTARVEDGTVTVRGEALAWQQLAPGIRVKALFENREAGRQAVLLELAPGASFPAHEHLEGVEECLVLRGEVRTGAVTARAGDYHAALAGSSHLPLETTTGALLFITKPLAA
jgi:anti-sigma factor ChrR (cupin superfamily)